MVKKQREHLADAGRGKMQQKRMPYYRAEINNKGYVIVKEISAHKVRFYKLCRLIPAIFPGAYCKTCLHPTPRGTPCTAHLDEKEYLNGTLAVGLYYTQDTRLQAKLLGGPSTNNLTSYILALKSRKDIAPLIGTAMATILKSRVYNIGQEDIDIITYVPKHQNEYKKDFDTGEAFNQAEILAQVVSRELEKPLEQLIVKRSPLSLSGLGINERYHRALTVYEVPSKAVSKIKDKRILLVDDVRTSGATGNAIAKLLKEANAQAVYLLVAGRATFTSQFIDTIQSLRKTRAH